MSSVINQEWLNQNSLRAYPLKEDCSRIPSVAGALLPDVLLPNYFIVDCVLTVPADVISSAYINSIAIVGNGMTISVADQAGVVMALTSVNLATHTRNKSYPLVGVDVYEDVRGRIVLGDLTTLYNDMAEGIYTFSLEATELESTVIRPALRDVRSLQVTVDKATSQYITGRVRLVAGANISLTYIPGYNAIRIDAISGDGLNEDCVCEDVGQDTVVKTVNGIPVEDLVLVGDSCIDVQTSGNTITFKDKCSTPCCGCPELEVITDTLKILEKTLSNLETYSNMLTARITTFMEQYVIALPGGQQVQFATEQIAQNRYPIPLPD